MINRIKQFLHGKTEFYSGGKIETNGVSIPFNEIIYEDFRSLYPKEQTRELEAKQKLESLGLVYVRDSETDWIKLLNKHGNKLADKFYPHLPTILKLNPFKILEATIFERELYTKEDIEQLQIFVNQQFEAYFYLAPYIQELYNSVFSRSQRRYATCDHCGIENIIVASFGKGGITCRKCYDKIHGTAKK